jgi:4-amino-4-deoxy-L-arabinose transferase-like glycosyltransferase
MASAFSERRLLHVVLAFGVLRLVLAGLLPIGDDEAYYWLWSRHLAWSYPDHPPMVAVVVAASTRLFGDGVFGIRAVNVVLASALPWVVCAAGKRIFDVETGVRAGWIAAALPALGVGTLIASPDVPMAFFWALSLWTGWEALRQGGRWWAAAGATVGLAMLSKLTSAGLILGVAGAALIGGAPAGARQILRDRWMYAGAVIAAALFAPVVLWNLEHHWFLAYITTHRERWMAPRFPLLNVASFAGGQVLYYGLLAPLLWAASVWTLRREGPVWRYLAWMSLPVFMLMTVAAAQARTKPHWPAPAYLAAGIALGALWPGWARARSRLVWGAAAVTGTVTVVFGATLLLPWGRAQVGTGIGRYDRLTDAVVRQAAAHPDRTLILTDRYQAASHIAYRVRERIPVTTFYGAFLVWQHPEAWEGWHAVYVKDDPERPSLSPESLCASLRQVDTVDLRPDRPPGPIKIFACDNVHLPSPPVVPPREPLP